MTDQTKRSLLLYIGTYTSCGGEGIYALRMDLSSGELSQPTLVARTANPSFLSIHPKTRMLYAVNEVDDFAGTSGGAVSAYRIDMATGQLTLLNRRPTHGASPCYVSVDATGRVVLVANYGGGNVAVYAIQADGSLSDSTDTVQLNDLFSERPQEAHAHSIRVTPGNHFVLVAALGLDKVLIYEFDARLGRLTPHHPPFVAAPRGAGPRHFEFHPSGRFLYVINEMGSSVTAYAYDAVRVSLSPIQTISTLPEGWTGENDCADIHLSPSGQFLYGSNRGHDSIVIFTVHEQSGMLSAVGHKFTGGRTPRHFALDPTGKFLLAANQDSNNIVVFEIEDAGSGLRRTGIEVNVSKPACLAFCPLSEMDERVETHPNS